MNDDRKEKSKTIEFEAANRFWKLAIGRKLEKGETQLKYG
jgi:hypothetical protein